MRVLVPTRGFSEVLQAQLGFAEFPKSEGMFRASDRSGCSGYNSPQNRDLYGPEGYTQSNANTNGRGLRLCFRTFGVCWRRKPQLPLAFTKEMWTFFGSYFALLDRALSLIRGARPGSIFF